MLCKILYFIFLLNCVASRQIPRFNELDEDDQQLFRAAYDTPTYDHDEYQEEDDLPLGKLDLLKDGLWAIKAKLKELKAFNKALAANLLVTKLKVKELLLNHKTPLKKHHHTEYKPYYQPPTYSTYEPHEQQYAGPQYAPPQYNHDPYYGN